MTMRKIRREIVITIGDQDVYTAPEAGIVMYSTDGYENKTADSLVEEDFDQMAYKKPESHRRWRSPAG